MSNYNKAVEAADIYRNAREALGQVVAKEVEAIYGLFIDNASIGSNVNSYYEIEGVVHVILVDIDFDVEEDYIILNMNAKYKTLPNNNYTIAFNKVGEGATLVNDMLVAFKNWQDVFESYKMSFESK